MSATRKMWRVRVDQLKNFIKACIGRPISGMFHAVSILIRLIFSFECLLIMVPFGTIAGIIFAVHITGSSSSAKVSQALAPVIVKANTELVNADDVAQQLGMITIPLARECAIKEIKKVDAAGKLGSFFMKDLRGIRMQCMKAESDKASAIENSARAAEIRKVLTK